MIPETLTLPPASIWYSYLETESNLAHLNAVYKTDI